MNKTFFAILAASALLTGVQPAFADHHGGQGQGMGMHSKMTETQMMDAKNYADRSMDMMKAGNMMIEEGAKKKDAKMMMKGAQLLKKGMMMHQMTMKGMKMMMEEMKHKIMHAKVGDLQVSDKEMADMEKMMKMMKDAQKMYQEGCHKEMAMMPNSSHLMMTMANEMMMKAMKDKNADQMMMGSEMMEMGMALMHPHGMMGGNHSGDMMRVEKRIMMHGNGMM
ncbi:hypothetical protein COW64_23395 [bacterium (Candidatus Blackallbacteria) CG18_big_fil_WC_8_21_14_2_50_49_26]|nr:MAG: hypothetical protein COW64_23395 [bacterium (Candidatus Blackallbacteria) CG18_big_fil_WC_8_21_14_2_50_49_26]